ncbi:hypothetical protein Amsp01_048400 [Amycolatopsis sp. NBRC 101858]|nr:hypothetical protein Amsp01_048400 [Amycolatopsis sp. NBRC 101858]
MWEFYEAKCRQGRTPSGADLDRIAGTHNHGRRILRKWRAADMSPLPNDPAQPQKPAAKALQEK